MYRIMKAIYEAQQASLEETLLADLSLDVPWSLIERFTTLVRESASEDERVAAKYITDKLAELGVPHKVYEPELFLSVPVKSRLLVGDQEIRAKSPAFSATTSPEGITGEVVSIPIYSPRSVDLFDVTPAVDVDVAGKIVLVDGYGGPPPVQMFEKMGAIAQIYINNGVDIHWGICTTIWGAPDLDNMHRQPTTPVISINRPDGEALRKQIEAGKLEVTVHTEMKEGWFECPVIVAEIEGQQEPDRFVLAHGHYDSWDVGIGDNAVGDAAMLELARVFHNHKDQLARSVKIAWWPGHSTGRYAGSTWFADTFGLELARDCIAQIDIDSPGCRWATEYLDVSWMTETEDFCVQAIKEVTGKSAQGERPHQAGDYSFNNIGISSFFMLLSTMPKDLVEEKNYYAVGGCGGNIGWHTENDQLEIADKENLLRDIQVYIATIQRVLNNPIHPFDFRKLAAEFHDTLTRYSEAAAGEVDFAPAFDALSTLSAALDSLYSKSIDLSKRDVTDVAVRAYNDALLEMGRELILINYTRQGRFSTEPAVLIPRLPDIEPALTLKDTEGHSRNVVRTHLVRGINKVAWAFETAAKSANRAIEKIEA
jgi:N-acetylated-alpha-linked acidic dipeptidase